MATAKSTAAKSRTAAKPATGKSAGQAAPERPAEAETAPGDTALRVKPVQIKIKDLVLRVTEATGGKKKDVKEIVEATLAALGDALGKGEDLNLPGLGRTRIAKTAEKDGAATLTLKVRRGAHKKKEAKEPLADDEDDG
ncbi:hypothetical protein MASR1M32_28100 [Rhodobacter sp.]